MAKNQVVSDVMVNMKAPISIIKYCIGLGIIKNIASWIHKQMKPFFNCQIDVEPPAYVRTARCMQVYAVVCCCMLLYSVVCCCMLLCAVVCCCVLLCAVVFSV